MVFVLSLLEVSNRCLGSLAKFLTGRYPGGKQHLLNQYVGVNATGTIGGVFASLMCPSGWCLSSGDVLSDAGAFVVRFRRVA